MKTVFQVGQEEIKMNEWIEINSDGLNSFIEVINLGPIFLLRTYRWCSQTDEMRDLQIHQIDHQTGAALVKQHKDK